MANWTEPKTDWNKESRFDKNDYNRIKNNLEHLKELAAKMYREFFWQDMGADMGYSDYIYADMVNKIEENLEALAIGTFNPRIGDKRQYYANQWFIRFDELNRIEEACLLLHIALTGQYEGIKRLSFVLNGGIF